MSSLLVLSRTDLETLLSPVDVVETLADAFRRYAAGLTTVPSRGVTPVTDDAVLFVMPAVVRPGHEADGAVGVKLVSVYPGNRARGHPTIQAAYVLMEVETGAPLALLEGTYVTALRTGATSALAARYLARPDAGRIACFGAGVQAAFQLRCLAAVLPITRVDLVARDPERADRFARLTAHDLGVPVTLRADARAAVRDADVITCATTSVSPVVFGSDVRAGAHVDAVGAFRPDAREVDTALVRRARVVVDTYAGAGEEAGDILIPLREGAIDHAHVAAELAELVTGAKPGRRSPDEVTLFKSVGFALEDLATARLAYHRARQRGIGTEVSL
ncbi:MAG: ornithine cyclodeaminase family protein [Candidatus Rokubacteria bacterium]|nr:ornithine cyclodeaminase family protein [Candidatus Rokubacteria bacterium]